MLRSGKYTRWLSTQNSALGSVRQKESERDDAGHPAWWRYYGQICAPRSLPRKCRWSQSKRSSLTAALLELPFLRRIGLYCSTPCMATLHSSPVEMKRKPRGVSSRLSKRAGHNYIRLRSAIMPPAPAVRPKRTHSSPVIIADGVTLKGRCNRLLNWH